MAGKNFNVSITCNYYQSNFLKNMIMNFRPSQNRFEKFYLLKISISNNK